MKIKNFIIIFLLCVSFPHNILKSQVLVESVAAIVGQEMVLLSDIEDRVYQQLVSGDKRPIEDIRCEVLNEILISKLFVDQSKIDSLVINDAYIDTDVNVRINEAIINAGSEETLEEYFRKDIIEIKNDIRELLVEQQIISQVQSSLVKDVKITPNDVRKFFSGIPKDSLPLIPAMVQVSIIQFNPPNYEESKSDARQKLLEIRNKIMEGQSFNVMAILNSDDPGSAINGGELGYLLKGNLEKEYADAAFALQPGSISRIIETRHGYHIIQMIDKKGDMANTRHILIKPKVSPQQTTQAINRLDSLAQAIRRDSISFEEAARLYSSHADSRTNGGKFVKSDPADRNRWFELKSFEQDMYMKIRDLKIGEISAPFTTTDDNGNTVFRIVRLDNEMPAHRANLKDDYQLLYNSALNKKKAEVYNKWIEEKITTTYIKISEECETCDFLRDGWIK